ncbi:MAG: HEAT repeat domain-containing protein [Gemmataceae bacterium]|nr:HEAT repeat domain-containing protein [Gemmataceae bacterium]
MNLPNKKKTFRWLPILCGVGVVLIALGFWQRDYGLSYYTAYQIRKASEAERLELAKKLVYQHPHGPNRLVVLLNDTDESLSIVARSALETYLINAQVPPTEKANLINRLDRSRSTFNDNGQLALLELIPALHQAQFPESSTLSRSWLESGLKSPSSLQKVKAIALIMKYNEELLPQVLPLVSDENPNVRRATILALGPVREGKPNLLDDEDLLKSLHDSDDEVRQLGELALRSRGRNSREISLGKSYTHPKAAERQKLLNELASEDELDISAWLERLSYDHDAAVRAGVARLMAMLEKPDRERLKSLAQNDSDPTVRRIADFYLDKTGP